MFNPRQITAIQLAAPLPIVQGGTGTSTPSLIAGTDITITGAWPNQTISFDGGATSGLLLSGNGVAPGPLGGDGDFYIDLTGLVLYGPKAVGEWPCTGISLRVPGNTPPIVHEWLQSYNASTGAFTQSQPGFADLSGVATPAQLPLATSTAAGIVKADGVTIIEAGDGTLSAVSGTSGTVTSVSVVTANGFQGSVANPTSTPAITLNVDGTHYLPSTTDEANWNAKQAAGNYLTALTGDVTATGPGSAASTLAAVGTAGTYTKVTTDAKGRVSSGTTLTAADIPNIAESQVTNLTTDLAAKAPLASPALTGIPTAPTATAGTNTTQIATTAFVEAALGSSGITQLTGDVTAGPGAGSQAATLAASGVTAGTYTNPTVTVDAKGRVTAASSASGSSLMSRTRYTSGRAVNTVYQNTTGYPLIVVGSVTNSAMTVYCDAAASPTTAVWALNTFNFTGDSPFVFTVPAGFYYKVSAPSVTFWDEYSFSTGTFSYASLSRTLGTVYQNTGSGALFVTVHVSGTSSGTPIYVYSDSSSSPSALAYQMNTISTDASAFFLVPPGDYYKVTSAAGSVASWVELSSNVSVTKSANLFTAGTRAVGTTYSNTSGTSVIWATALVTDTGTNTWCLKTSVPPAALSIAFQAAMAGSQPKTALGPVLPGYSYDFTQDVGTPSTQTAWWEYTLSGGAIGSGVTAVNGGVGAVTIAAGTGTSVSTSGSTVTVTAPVMVGDSGSGGTAGIVPAPAAGDAAAGKFLKADGTFAVPPGSGGITLTTTGTSGAATLSSGVLNVPVYSGGGGASYFNAMAFTTPPTTGWTTDNLGTGGTFDTTYGYPYIHGPLGAGADNNRSAFRSVASTPWTITAGILFDLSGVVHGGNTNTGNVGVGLVLKDGSGKQITFRVAIPANSVNIAVNVDKWTSSTSYSANYAATTANQYAAIYGPIHQPMLMQISDDGTNLIFRLTIDGNHWYTFFSVSRTNWFASGPTQVGFHVGCYNSSGDNFGVDAALISWAQS